MNQRSDETIEQRIEKLKNLGAGDETCVECLNIRMNDISVCKKCIDDTPAFNELLKEMFNRK